MTLPPMLGPYGDSREMLKIVPQKIPANLNPRIFEFLSTSMNDLLNPSVGDNSPIPAFISEIDALFPPGNSRDCLHAGLWIVAGDIHRAHNICQNVPTKFGSAWHAIMHRQEGDFWNCKYVRRSRRGCFQRP
jgi:hypothetical protein